jgi:hypothetical protein
VIECDAIGNDAETPKLRPPLRVRDDDKVALSVRVSSGEALARVPESVCDTEMLAERMLDVEGVIESVPVDVKREMLEAMVDECDASAVAEADKVALVGRTVGVRVKVTTTRVSV